MKQDAYDQAKQRAADEISQRQAQAQAQDNPHATQDQDFYTRLGLSGPETEAATPDDTFVVSIYCHQWTRQEIGFGKPSLYSTELDYATVDANELVQHVKQYRISETPCSHPEMSPEACFRATFPIEDRAYFEQGVHKYYGMLVHEINGQPPTSVDYQRIADLIGIRFDYRPNPHDLEDNHGPDLWL